MEARVPGENYTKGNSEFKDIPYSEFKPNRDNKAINVGGGIVVKGGVRVHMRWFTILTSVD